MSTTSVGVAPSGECLWNKGRHGSCGWQVKLCDPLAIGPYLSALEMWFMTKRYTNRRSLLYYALVMVHATIGLGWKRLWDNISHPSMATSGNVTVSVAVDSQINAWCMQHCCAVIVLWDKHAYVGLLPNGTQWFDQIQHHLNIRLCHINEYSTADRTVNTQQLLCWTSNLGMCWRQ